MKNLLTLLLTITTLCVQAFDYKTYVVTYLDSVNKIEVGDGTCSSLLYEMFKPIADSMLIDTRKGAWGQPVTDITVGDVLVYGNHISVVYSVNGSEVVIADQNNGKRKTVLIHRLPLEVFGFDNFQVFRPIMLKDVLYSDKGRDFCLKLFIINTKDIDKVSRSTYKPSATERHYIDLILEYTLVEYEFALYFKGKAYTGDNGECRVETPTGYIVVEKLDMIYFKPIKVVVL